MVILGLGELRQYQGPYSSEVVLGHFSLCFFLNLKVLIDQGPMTEVANEVQAAVFISGSLFI